MKGEKTEQGHGVGATSMSLLSEGKSSRLMQMRQQAMGQDESQPASTEPREVEAIQKWDRELFKVRQLIDRRLQEAMAGFPPNKRQRFFKIRYGMTPEQLKLLPIQKILAILKLKQKASADMKRIADLDYNGRPTSNRAEN